MIIRPPTNWLRMLFVWDGSVLKTIVPQLLLMLAISVLAVVTAATYSVRRSRWIPCRFRWSA
jgi:predicted membrane chloride channel (bestrophin family)